jgi:uncharacterized phage-associated protein
MDYHKEKIDNLIVYFVKNTKRCGITKLCKLLYYADFRHFKETGESITGLVYKAWEQGPVPSKLYGEISHSPEKLEKVITINKFDRKYNFIPKKEFDDQYFTDREIRIIKETVYIFKNRTANEMSQSTHFIDEPWEKVTGRKHYGGIINYELAFDSTPKTIHPDKYKELKRNKEMIENIFSNDATR